MSRLIFILGSCCLLFAGIMIGETNPPRSVRWWLVYLLLVVGGLEVLNAWKDMP